MRGKLADLRGQTLAIDAPCVLHRLWARWARESRYKLTRADTVLDGAWRAFVVREVGTLFSALNMVGCRTILVNEGAAPFNKRRVIQRRQVYREAVRRRADRVLLQTEPKSCSPAESDDEGWILVAPRKRRSEHRASDAVSMRRAVRRYNASIPPSQHDYRLMNEIASLYGATTIAGLSEAETVCAALVRFGLADLTMSNDTDAIVYVGGVRIICDLFLDEGGYEYVDRARLVSHLGARSEEEFVRALVCCGTDYNAPLRPGLTPTTALEEVRMIQRVPASHQEVVDMYLFTRPGDEKWPERLRKALRRSLGGKKPCPV
jgi:hypothetical protein